MIKVNFMSNGNHFTGFKSSGHANYNMGNDIVCAAVSALAYTLLGTLQNVANIRFPKTRVREGNMRFSVTTDDPQASEVVDVVFKTIYIGMLQLQKTYPKNIYIHLTPIDVGQVPQEVPQQVPQKVE